MASELPSSYRELLARYQSGELSQDDVLNRLDHSDGIFIPRMKRYMNMITVAHRSPPTNPLPGGDKITIDMNELDRMHQYHRLSKMATKLRTDIEEEARDNAEYSIMKDLMFLGNMELFKHETAVNQERKFTPSLSNADKDSRVDEPEKTKLYDINNSVASRSNFSSGSNDDNLTLNSTTRFDDDYDSQDLYKPNRGRANSIFDIDNKLSNQSFYQMDKPDSRSKLTNTTKKSKGVSLSSASLFEDNWVSKGGLFDADVLRHPTVYPEGDVTVKIPKIEGTSSNHPRIGWAHSCKRKGQHICEGVYVCPEYGNGCHCRDRPKLKRRGNNSYNTGGKDPAPSFNCPVHNVELTRMRCKCKWEIKDKGDHWILNHHGSHDHPAPQLAGATDSGKRKLEDFLRVTTDLDPADLQAGTDTREKITEVDPKFKNRDHLRHQKRQILKRFKQQTTGSAYATEALDAAWNFFNGIEKWKDSVYDTCVGGMSRPPQIVIATESMQERCRVGTHPFQTDTLEGTVDSVYFPGQINVTMTSTWCPIVDGQVPVLVSILYGKSTESYKAHFKYLFDFFVDGKKDMSTIEEFCEMFPGNTCDFSEAERKGFFAALDDIIQSEYGSTMTSEMKEQLYRYCEVHFKKNLEKAASISKAVDPSRKDEFKSRCLELLTIHSFNDFAESIQGIYKDFPDTKKWLAWYLQNDRARIFFPACKQVPTFLQGKFDTLKKDINAQEGLGGYFKNFRSSKDLNDLITNISYWVGLFDTDYKNAKEGIKRRYNKKASKKDKRKGREKQYNTKHQTVLTECFLDRRQILPLKRTKLKLAT